MVEGKEPLRSFGDLMQFFDKDKKTVKEPVESKPDPKPAKVVAEAAPVADSDQPVETPKPVEAPQPVDAPEPVAHSQASSPEPVPPAEPSDS